MDRNLPADAGDAGLIPGPEDSTCHGATETCATSAETTL